MTKRVVFVDWHGVLSSTPFWSSILHGEDRDLAAAVHDRLRTVWSSELGADWMRGEIRLWEIIKPLCSTAGRIDDRLAGVLRSAILRDCLTMTVHAALADTLRSIAPHAWRIIATDNAAEFDEAFRRARRTRRLADTAAPGSMCELAGQVDGLLCSSARGVLKADNPAVFFGDWLTRKRLRFTDAVLVDDREDNRAAFEAHGGTSIAWSADPAVQAAALDAIGAFADPAATLAAASS
jgi:hypothetical protein